MRVLHCIWRLSVGGAERQLILLADSLAQRGLEVHVAVALPGVNDSVLEKRGIRLHRLGIRGKYNPLVWPTLLRLLRTVQPDVVHTWLTQMDVLAGLCEWVRHRSWVLSERSTAAAYPPSFLHMLRRTIGARASAIVANSALGEEYWKTIVNQPERIHIIPNIVPQADIDAASAITPRDEPRLSPADRVVLYVGRFSNEKNLETLLRGIARVMKKQPVKAVFCGNGSLLSAMERSASNLGIAHRALFLGNVSNVWSWMKRADVMVSLSVFEGDPNSVLEAVACDTPLVLSDIPAHRDLVGGDGAWLVDPHSEGEVSRAIEAALTQPQIACDQKTRARRCLLARSPEEIAARYHNLYLELATSRGSVR